MSLSFFTREKKEEREKKKSEKESRKMFGRIMCWNGWSNGTLMFEHGYEYNEDEGWNPTAKQTQTQIQEQNANNNNSCYCCCCSSTIMLGKKSLRDDANTPKKEWENRKRRAERKRHRTRLMDFELNTNIKKSHKAVFMFCEKKTW